MEKEVLKYRLIKSYDQYLEYCHRHEELASSGDMTEEVEDEMEILGMLIDRYDNEQHPLTKRDPVEALKSIMENNRLSAKDLSEGLGINKGIVSDILNYHRKMSKSVIFKISERFKVMQEVFNRPYDLKPRPRKNKEGF